MTRFEELKRKMKKLEIKKRRKEKISQIDIFGGSILWYNYLFFSFFFDLVGKKSKKRLKKAPKCLLKDIIYILKKILKFKYFFVLISFKSRHLLFSQTSLNGH